jgi:hypothetical protein
MTIGKPKRTFTIEPVENPVPKLAPPERAPAKPAPVPVRKEPART